MAVCTTFDNGVNKKKLDFLRDMFVKLWAPPPSINPFSPLLYKYFFRNCTQKGVTIQKIGFNKKGFQGIFYIFDFFSGRGGGISPKKFSFFYALPKYNVVEKELYMG